MSDAEITQVFIEISFVIGQFSVYMVVFSPLTPRFYVGGI